MSMSEPEKRKLWVKAGGRCTLCKRYLLEGNLTAQTLFLGEDAHIVGQRSSSRSPRGISNLPEADRDKADNILLACSTCHTEIDKTLAAKVMTVEVLRKKKAEHENEIFHQTGLTYDRRTTILRIQGWVRGAITELGREDAALAVIWSSNRFPFFLPAYDQQSIELDLRNIDGEEDGTPAYYAIAQRKIDQIVADRIREGVQSNQIKHISIFAIARLPLLIYLGWRIDDGIPADVYQRHRMTNDWRWPHERNDTHFTTEVTSEGGGADEDGVLITNISGTTRASELPDALHNAVTWTISPSGHSHEDAIGSSANLRAFEEAVRRFFLLA